jgi:hypothetical protein
MSSVRFGVHWSGKLMEGKANLVGVIKYRSILLTIKREKGILPEQNVDGSHGDK